MTKKRNTTSHNKCSATKGEGGRQHHPKGGGRHSSTTQEEDEDEERGVERQHHADGGGEDALQEKMPIVPPMPNALGRIFRIDLPDAPREPRETMSSIFAGGFREARGSSPDLPARRRWRCRVATQAKETYQSDASEEVRTDRRGTLRCRSMPAC